MKNIDRFAVTEAQLRALVAEGLKDGGDWCDLYFEDTVYNDFLLRDSEVNSAGYHVDYGCGIRVLKGEKTGYAYSESTAFPELLRAARTAASIASVTSAGETRPFRSCGSTSVPGVNHYPVLLDWNSADCGKFAPFLKRIEAGIRSRESRTLKVIGMLSWSMSEILMYNSLGELTSDSRHAAKALSILLSYSEVLKDIPGTNDAPLLAGLEGLKIIYATEILRHTYDGMEEKDFSIKKEPAGKQKCNAASYGGFP